MAGPWQRAFVAAARFGAWCVLLTPLAVTAALVVAGMLGRQPPDVVVFLGQLVVQLAVTLAIAIAASAAGASIGAGTAFLTRELGPSRAAGLPSVAIGVLASCPSVVLGWFGAVLVLPALTARSGFAIYAAATAVVTLAVIPRAFVLTARALGRVPEDKRAAAAAAGAAGVKVAVQVVLPAIRTSLWGAYLDAFARAVSEAAAVALVFLAAARAGYPVAVLTLPSWMLAHARSVATVDAGIAQAALLVLGLAVAAKAVAARRDGGMQWA